MLKKIERIKETINEAKDMPAIRAAAKIALAEKAIADAVTLWSEMAHRIEMLEGVTGARGEYEQVH
ncbi:MULTISPECIES: hypothetical protein [unclassified Pseudoalteromonas]|uniref:hypothetical protein n=1 Tax=unclassified Pseudoalteromonas TaxID=194690 RepID=UPI0030155238